jgi:hypothetical protein
VRRLILAVALATLAAPAVSEQFTAPLAAPGVVKADLDPVLYLNGAAIADPGWTLAEAANGRDYTFDDLPDVAAGAGDRYALCWSHLGDSACYLWPQETRTPQAVRWEQRFVPTPEVIRIGTGDTAIPVQLTITGLASDPTGSAVAFSMRRSSGGAAVIDGAAATLADVDQVVDPVTAEVTWTAEVVYDFTAEDTEVAGEYRSWFTLTFPLGGVMTAPPTRDRKVSIF